jgi:hypothetical protein
MDSKYSKSEERKNKTRKKEPVPEIQKAQQVSAVRQRNIIAKVLEEDISNK